MPQCMIHLMIMQCYTFVHIREEKGGAGLYSDRPGGLAPKINILPDWPHVHAVVIIIITPQMHLALSITSKGGSNFLSENSIHDFGANNP